MTTSQVRVLGAALFFLFIFLTGFLLTRSGKPYGTMILTLHKLIGLAAGIILGITIYQTDQVAQLSTSDWTAAAVTALLFLVTGISGGLVSTDMLLPAATLTVHRISPVLTLLSTAATLFLLSGGLVT